MTDSSPIADFLRARYDKEAADAQEVLDGNARDRADGTGSTLWDGEDADASWTLRDIESKRRIIDEMIPVLEDLNELAYSEGQAAKRPGRPGEYMTEDHEPELHLLRLLALPYEGHPDYPSAVTP